MPSVNGCFSHGQRQRTALMVNPACAATGEQVSWVAMPINAEAATSNTFGLLAINLGTGLLKPKQISHSQP